MQTQGQEEIVARGTHSQPWGDYKGAVRANWRNLANKDNADALFHSIMLWVNTLKPGSSEKRAKLLFTAGDLFAQARMNGHDARWFIDEMDKANEEV